LLYQAGTTGIIAPEVGFVTIDERFKVLRQINWETLSKDHAVKETASTV
jgi:glutamyl-tRNA synthetase